MSIKIRLMTGNFLGNGADSEAVAKTIESVRPDVVPAQELGPKPAEVFSAMYPYHFSIRAWTIPAGESPPGFPGGLALSPSETVRYPGPV